jgi:hypothetical protein
VVEERLGVVKEVPVPREIPPVETSYQFKVPALAVAPKTMVPASQRDPGVVELILGASMVAVTAVLAEVQPPLDASTKYVVVEERVGVVKDVPVPSETPPVEAAYQFKVPALAVAPRTRVPASHLEAGVVELMLGIGSIVAITAVLEEVQLPLVTST